MTQHLAPVTCQRASLVSLIVGYMASRTVHIAAQLGIADLLAASPKTTSVLAAETGAHRPSLDRLLRALASFGLLKELDDKRFALTRAGNDLRTGVPGSLHHLALMFGGERAWRSWSDLHHSVMTGESATKHVYGVGTFDYLAARPEQAAIFNAAMSDLTRQTARAVVAAYDFSSFRTIVDIGGGNGTLISAILAANQQLRGAVFDLPRGTAEAPHQLAAAHVDERCDVLPGDFFCAVPAGADAYLLKSVIHDWDDNQAVIILENCRKAILSSGKLLLIERVMPTRMEATERNQQMAMFDLNTLVMQGGRERTAAEYHALLRKARFTLQGIIALDDVVGLSLLEAIPV